MGSQVLLTHHNSWQLSLVAVCVTSSMRLSHSISFVFNFNIVYMGDGCAGSCGSSREKRFGMGGKVGETMLQPFLLCGEQGGLGECITACGQASWMLRDRDSV